MTNLLTEESKGRLRQLLDLNDHVNELTARERDINATQIVVAGDQSHGKTSVLEALSGIDLPRGEGIKTRVPLIMKLRKCLSSSEEYAEISGSQSSGDGDGGADGGDSVGQTETAERIALDKVALKVDEYTARLAGDGKDVRDLPITLKVFRHDQDNLTLIDLPGITRVALEGQAGGDGKRLEDLIMKMCHHYMAPEESILLNVVSAMVDFSTSASLQLSRDLDPSGERTMLCVTKIDQHHEAGIGTKLGDAIVRLKLRPQHIFAVRNRSQAENDDALPLIEARAIERTALEANAELNDGAREQSYGLGVAALSKMLVQVQFERIHKTLPEVGQRISKKLGALKHELAELGDNPTGDHECRMLAHRLIEQYSDRLKFERNGRAMATGTAACSSEASPKGEICDVVLRVDDLTSLRESRIPAANYESLNGATKTVNGDVGFYLCLHPIGLKPQSLPATAGFSFGVSQALSAATGQQERNVGLFLHCTKPAAVSSVMCEYTLTCTDEKGTELKSKELTRTLNGNVGFGSKDFMKSKEIDGPPTIRGVTFCATVYVLEATMESAQLKQPMMCAKLSDLDKTFACDVNNVRNDKSFFTPGFRTMLKKEHEMRKGGIGLPGTIAPDVSLSVLAKMREQLPEVIGRYVEGVFEMVNGAFKTAVDDIVDAKANSKYALMMKATAEELINQRRDEAKRSCDKLLKWEKEVPAPRVCVFVCVYVFHHGGDHLIDRMTEARRLPHQVNTLNHYYMDTVQKVRSQIIEQSLPVDKSKYPFLANLDLTSIKKMGNEEQELVDLQIKIFAYWKTMKKRFIDCVQLAVHSDLVTDSVETIKDTLTEVVTKHANIISLMASDEYAVRKRTQLKRRVERLTEADTTIRKRLKGMNSQDEINSSLPS